MRRLMRLILFLLLATVWTAGLFVSPDVAMAQSGSFRGHIVQPGETLESIAAQHHTTTEELISKNQLPTPVQLVPGQLLRIYDWSDGASTGDTTTTNPYEIPLWEQDLVGEKWIDINLTDQTLTAYVGETPVRTFVISSGGPGHETVTGSFRIWAKVSIQDMSGGSRAAGTYYYVEDVPWVQYFYADYSIHGADWHNDFGWPVSHGCVNMRVEEARWLFEWAEPHLDAKTIENGTWVFTGSEGTRVEVHY